MKEEFKAYGMIFMAMLSCFLLGAYTSGTFIGYREVEFFRWVLTSGFGFTFLVVGLYMVRNLK